MSFSRSDSVADLSTLSWVNALISWLWPKANAALTEYVHGDLEQRLREMLPSAFKEAKFAKFTLGQNPPEFGPVEVAHHSDTHIEVCIDMHYTGDVDVVIDTGTGGIALGIRHLSFSGRVCIVLKPLLEKMPIVGAAKVFFPALPRVSLQFTGLAAVAHNPQLEQMIRQTVDDWMRSRMVLPHASFHVFGTEEEDVDPLDAYCIAPLGVLRVRVLSARYLAGINWKMTDVEAFDVHPYCVLRLGEQEGRTSVVACNTCPTWPADERSHYFVVQHRDQQLEVTAFGEDQGGMFGKSADGFLGAAGLVLSRAMKQWPKQHSAAGVRKSSVVLDTALVSKDMLHVNDPVLRGRSSEVELELEWFDMLEELPSDEQGGLAAAAAGDPVAVLLVELRSGVGFPWEGIDEKAGLRWRCRSEDAQKTSRRGVASNVEEAFFPEVALNPRLFSVVDKLVDRGYESPDIARVLGLETTELVEQYFAAKKEFEAQQEEVWQKQQEEDFRVSVVWNEVLTLFVCVPSSASISIELLDGQDNVVGLIGPVPMSELISDSALALPREWVPLELAAAPKEEVTGGLAAWFLPSRTPKAPDVARYSTVELDVSAQLRPLRAGRGMPHRGRRK